MTAGEDGQPVPRDAATVVLLRDGPGGLEAYLIRRVRAMSFAGGMHAFPGGSVDPADRGPGPGWAGPPAGWWAGQLGCAPDLARALVCAAVRETFEECGVLLAGPAADRLLDDVGSDEWEQERRSLEGREQSLSELLRRRALVLRADLLRPVAHWITPVGEPRRFDTRFLLAALPRGQRCRDVGGEADVRLWVRPRAALESGLPMLPPTRAVLAELADQPDVESALAADRVLTTVVPQLVPGPGGALRVVLPGEVGYRTTGEPA